MAMDKDRIEGEAVRTEGAMKQGAGAMSGDTRIQAEGRMDRIKGKTRSVVGRLKDLFKR